MTLDDEIQQIGEGLDLGNENDTTFKIVSEMISDTKVTRKGIETRTELNDTELKCIVILSTVGKKMKIKELNNIVELFCRLKISRNRQGRKELIEAIKSSLENSKNDLKNDIVKQLGR